MRISTTQVQVNDRIQVWDGVFTVVKVNRFHKYQPRWTVRVVDDSGNAHTRYMNSAGSVIKL